MANPFEGSMSPFEPLKALSFQRRRHVSWILRNG